MLQRTFNNLIGTLLWVFLAPFLLGANPVVYFESNFEKKLILVQKPVLPGHRVIFFYEGQGSENWPVNNGQAVIYCFNGKLINQFTYQHKKGDKLIGIRGINNPFPKMSLIQIGDLSEWRESNPNIQAVTQPKISGLFSASISSPKRGIVAMTQPLGSLQNVWVRFEILFSKEYLKLKKRNTFHVLIGAVSQREFVNMRVVDNLGIPQLRLKVRHGLGMDTLKQAVSVMADTPYSVYYHYQMKDSTHFTWWLNGQQIQKTSAPISQDTASITRIRFLTYDPFPYYIDGVKVTDGFEGFQPETPPPAQVDSKIITVNNSMEKQGEIQIQIAREDSVFFPIYESPRLSGPRFRLNLENILPQQGIYYLRLKSVSTFGRMSPWTDPISISFKSSDSLQFKPLVKKVSWLSVETAKPVSVLTQGSWYDLQLVLEPKAWNQSFVLDLYNQAAAFNNQWVFDAPFSPGDNLRLFINLNSQGIWVSETPGTQSLSEMTGRLGSIIDATPERLILDPEKNRVQFGFHVLPNMKPGLWTLRQVVHEHQFYQQIHIKPFIKQRKRAWLIGAIFFLMFGFSVFILLVKKGFRKPKTAPYPSIVVKAINEIEKNYRQNINFHDLAKSMGYVEAHFRRTFKKFTHQTPLQYLITYRLEMASQFLMQNNDTVSEIAYRVGFSDPGYFMQLFKKEFDKTPGQWREQRKKT